MQQTLRERSCIPEVQRHAGGLARDLVDALRPCALHMSQEALAHGHLPKFLREQHESEQDVREIPTRFLGESLE